LTSSFKFGFTIIQNVKIINKTFVNCNDPMCYITKIGLVPSKKKEKEQIRN